MSALALQTYNPAHDEASPLDRELMLARLAANSFDLLVIGGGINGAAVARDAALRGLQVAVVDRGDFAGATSSRSSKLIHGGLRYLPQGQLRMVYGALRERERLRHVTAPHLVHPIQLLMPFFRGLRPGRLAIAAGLMLYDVMAVTTKPERHHLLSASRVHQIEPGLRMDHLKGGATYWDGSGDDARITLENILDAAYHGAAVVNYAAVEGLDRSSSVPAVAIRDLETRTPIELRARCIVNAAGPWVDDIRRMDDSDCTPSIRLTKGVHVVIKSDRLPVRNALVLSDNGGRIIFVMPHEQFVLVGTTDTDFNGDRELVAADRGDIDYLIGILRDALPEFGITAADAVSSFAGLRALPRLTAHARPSSVPREEVIIESPSGLITVAGGKLTTHRRIAEQVVNLVCQRLGLPIQKSPTLTLPLPGARVRTQDAAENEPAVPAEIRRSLNERYGTRASQVIALAVDKADLIKPLVDGGSTIRAEVIFATRYEMARSVSDFIVRRTAMNWRAPLDLAGATPTVARLMARELGWTPEREMSEVRRLER
jgi:glycerol-3-phosphate dehydrogenase